METRWERLSGLAGVAFAVLIFVALAVQGVLPNADAPGDEIRDFFADDRGAIMAGVWLRFLAGFAFVWFLGTLRSALRRAEDRTGQALAFGYRIASRSAIACQPGRTAPAYVRA